MAARTIAMAAPLETVRDLLGAQLRAVGVERLYATGAALVDLHADGVVGDPFPGVEVELVAEAEVASALADAAGRLHPSAGAGAALLPGQMLRLTSAPGARVDAVTIDEVEQLPATLAAWSIGVVHTSVDFVLHVDLDEPLPAGLLPLQLGLSAEAGVHAVTLDPGLAEMGIVLLAGPGVARAGIEAVEALHRFAARVGAGVVNTWGAKGLYRWNNPHHHGTVGLQARDFELAGLLDGRIVIAVGIDPLEAPDELWRSGRVIDVSADQLDFLAVRWPDGPPPPVDPPPALFALLRDALEPLYASEASPLTPAKAASDLDQLRPDGALVVADPGPAGLWVARTLPTTELGSVIVPATNTKGFAAAGAVVAGQRGRKAIGVITDPIDPVTAAVLDHAASRGIGVVLEVWGADAAIANAAARREQLMGALARPKEIHVLPVPVDFALTRTLVEIAGEVIAWQGPR